MKMKPFRYSTQIALRETINGLLWFKHIEEE